MHFGPASACPALGRCVSPAPFLILPGALDQPLYGFLVASAERRVGSCRHLRKVGHSVRSGEQVLSYPVQGTS